MTITAEQVASPAEDSPERLRERREALGLERGDSIFARASIYEGNIAHVDLDALEARCKDTIAEWTLVYAQSGETLPDDAVETKAARETLALITRLRAAEARTAWQPIETAPRADDDAPPWVLGLYVGGHVYAVMPLRSGGWMDMDGNRRHAPIAWAPLPAAPEAPHG